MKRKKVAYKNKGIICEYQRSDGVDNQIVYLGQNEYVKNPIKDGKFTRNSYHFRDSLLYAVIKINPPDPLTGIATGGNYIIDHSKKVGVISHVIEMDTHKGIETFRDVSSNSITMVARMNMDDFSNAAIEHYYPSGQLKGINSFDNNLLHGASLYYFEDLTFKPLEGAVSSEKKQLSDYMIYDQGKLVKHTVFCHDMCLPLQETIINKNNPDDVHIEHYTYNKDGTYEVVSYNGDYHYQSRLMDGTKMLVLDKFAEDGRAIYMEEHTETDPIYGPVFNKQKQYFPNEWDDEGNTIGGTLKRFKEGMLDSVVPFTRKENKFVYHGQRVFRDGTISRYEAGQEIETCHKKVIEKNGELIIALQKPISESSDKTQNPPSYNHA